jgi:hypothetical protein
MKRDEMREDVGPSGVSCVTAKPGRVKRYLINAMQMSAAVTAGLLLAPVLLSIRSSLFDFLRR